MTENGDKKLIQSLIEKFTHDRNRRLRAVIIILVVAAMVAASVFWVMRIIGITMSDEPGCGIPEHHHTEECIVSRTLICGLEENEGHRHTDECYDIVYGCGMEEHTHTVLCYPDPNADVESEEYWLTTFASYALNGDWMNDLVAVARSQVGYTESIRNYILGENNEHKGYTRYGAWYGNEYGDWNAMFVAFCLNYAGVPNEAVPINSGAESLRIACSASSILEGSEYAPAPGDLVFFDNDGDGAADSVGIVTEYGMGIIESEPTEDSQKATDEQPVVSWETEDPFAPETTDPSDDGAKATDTDDAENREERLIIRVIEGDIEDTVEETVYTADDSAVIGFVNINTAKENYIERMLALYPDETPAMTEDPSGSARVGEEPTRGDMSGITGVTTVVASLNFDDDDTDHGFVSVIATLRDVTAGTVVGTKTLSEDNNWADAFTGLNTSSTYRLEYSEPMGYVLDPYRTTQQAATWTKVTSSSVFQNGGVYAFVNTSSSEGARVLGGADEGSEYLDYYTVAVDENGAPVSVPLLAQWSASNVNGSTSASSTGNYGYLQCVGSPGMYMHKFADSNVSSGYSFGMEDSSKNNVQYIRYNTSKALYNTNTATHYLKYGTLANGYVYDFIGVTSSSQADKFDVYRKTLTTGNTTEVTINMHKVNEFAANEPKLVHNKTIDWLGGSGDDNPDTTVHGNDDYRLYLDVISKSDPVDLLLIIDLSNSMGDHWDEYVDMYDSNGNRITRIQAVNNFLNGENNAGGFIEEFLSANIYNQLGIVTFSSDENATGQYAYLKDSSIYRPWGRDNSNVNFTAYNADGGGTNYCAGLYRAEDMLNSATVANDGHRKIVVFMSDGEPTYSLASKTATAATGSGQETTDEVGAETFSTIYEVCHRFPNVDFHSVAFHGTGSEFVLDYLTELASYGHGSFNDATNFEALRTAIRSTMFPDNVTITDYLSDYVDYNESQPDLIVTVKNSSGTTVLFQNGSVTSAGQGVINSCTYSNGAVTLNFDEDYILDPADTFTVSFNVTLSNFAKQEYEANNGYSDMVGDYGTDYGTNHTSSKMPGFYSNIEAQLDYTLGSKYYREHYKRPVVQTEHGISQSGANGAAFQQSKTIDWLGDGDGNSDTDLDDSDPTNNNIDDYRLYLDFSGSFSTPYDLLIVIDKSGSMKWDINGNETSDTGLPSREDLVEEALNGPDGLIQSFLGMNEDNRVAVVTFGGEPDLETYGWHTIGTNLQRGSIVRLIDSDGYALAASATSSGSIGGYSSGSPYYDTEYTEWNLGTASNNPHDGYFLMINQATGRYLTYSNGEPTMNASGGAQFTMTSSGYLKSYNGYYLCYNSNNGWYMDTSYSYAVRYTTIQERTYSYHYNMDTAWVREWGRSTNNVSLDVPDSAGTNYAAGLRKAEEVLDYSGNPNQIMLFISDGVPTYWLVSDTERGGTGSENAANAAAARNATLTAVTNFKNKYAATGLITRAILFNTNTSTDVSALNALDSSGTAITSSDAQELITKLNDMIHPTGIQVQDKLSQYVSYDPTQGDLKVYRHNLDGTGTPVLLYYVDENGVGHKTTEGEAIIDSVIYTPASGADTTGTITLNFIDSYVLEPEYRFEMSFNVKTTQLAKDEFAENLDNGDPTGYNNVVGDIDTDYGTNDTSSTMPGFHSNTQATLTYTYGVQNVNPYAHPVVQVPIPEEIPDVNTDVLVCKNWSDYDDLTGSRPSKITVTLYANGIPVTGDGIINPVDLNDNNGWSYHWYGLPAYDEDGNPIVYTISEVAVDGYTTTVVPTEVIESPTPAPTAEPTAEPTATPEPTPEPTQAPTGYTVTFNANGGTFGSSQYEAVTGVASGTQFSTLAPFSSTPTHSNENYSFRGWYTAANGGTEVKGTDTVTGNVEVYAHWNEYAWNIDTSGTFVEGDYYYFADSNNKAITNSTDGSRVTASAIASSGKPYTNQIWIPSADSRNEGYYYFQNYNSTDYYLGYGQYSSNYYVYSRTSDNDYCASYTLGAATNGRYYLYYDYQNSGYDAVYASGSYYRISSSNRTPFTIYHWGVTDVNGASKGAESINGFAAGTLRSGFVAKAPESRAKHPLDGGVRAGEVYEPTTTIETGKDYLIGYIKNGNVYLLMNYNPNGSSNKYYYNNSNNYYGYGVKAILDSSGNVIGVDTSEYSGATMTFVTWRFVNNSGKYGIQSGYQSNYYLRIHNSSNYVDCYPANDTSYNNWTWDDTYHTLMYSTSSVTKYIDLYNSSNTNIAYYGADGDPTTPSSTRQMMLFKLAETTPDPTPSPTQGGDPTPSPDPTPTPVPTQKPDYSLLHHWTFDLTNTIVEQPLAMTKYGLKYGDELSEAQTLEGAEFLVYVCDSNWNIPENSQPYRDVISLENGVVDFGSLPYGHYVLTESVPPAGYAGAGPWHVTVSETGTLITEVNGDPVPVTTGDNNTPIIANYSSYELPHTGGIGTTLYMTGGFALILMPVSIWLARSKERWKGKGGKLKKPKDRPPRDLE